MKTIKTTKDSVKAHYALKGQDAVELAKDYVAAWAAKVGPGTMTILAKMPCEMADGPCGCKADGLSFYFKCSGPKPPVPVEILMEVLEQGVEGVEVLNLPAPEVIVVDGKVTFVEFIGPDSVLAGGEAVAKYVKKL